MLGFVEHSNAYLRRITTRPPGGKTSRSRRRILLPVLTGTPRPAHHNQNSSNSYSSY
ncbi:hypothetical protein ACLK1S_15425 [Escherichia coli]